MAVRLSKIAREFNVGLSTIVEFLHKKGIQVSSDPNAKLTDEDYTLVAKEFSSDSEVKKASSMVDLRNSRKKKETVTIDNVSNVTEENDEDEFISVKDEVKLEHNLKVVDHIDLDQLNKPKQEEPQPEKPKTEPAAVQTPAEKVVEPQKEEDSSHQEEKYQPAQKEETVNEEKEEPVTYKAAQPAVKEVKVVGSIDLDAINQRTRPPKKSKQEKERDRKELRKPTKSVPETNTTPESNDDSEKKKRKRIIRQDEKVQVETPAKGGGMNAKVAESQKKLKKLKKKKSEKAEITEEDVDRQIKDTFARLGNKGKSQTSKHRSD